MASFVKHAGNIAEAGEGMSLEKREASLDRALQSPSRLFFKSLKDYEELLYMSNIFLQFQKKGHISMLQLNLVKVV